MFVYLGQITAGNDSRRLVVDAHLEAGRAPVDELDGALRLDGRDRRIHILKALRIFCDRSGRSNLGHDVASEEQTDGHVLAVTRVAFDHLVVRFETHVRDLGHR